MDELFENLPLHTKRYINFMVDRAIDKGLYDPQKGAVSLMELREMLETEEEKDFMDFSYEVAKMSRGVQNYD